jgi:putative transposase
MTELQKVRIQHTEETRERRKSQVARVFELKISLHHLSEIQQEKLKFLFIQAKRVINDMLSKSENSSIFSYNYKDHKTVQVKFPDGHFEDRNIDLPSAMHQDLCQSKMQDIKNLSKSKKKGRNVGRLKFKNEVNCIPIRTGMIRISKKHKDKISIPGFTKLRVRGLDEIRGKNYELANATLIQKPSGIYLHICLMFPKKKSEKKTSIGIDMGIKQAITTSNGKTYDPIVEETEHLKKLQRKLARQTKGSNRYEKVRLAIRKEYEHISNIKNDLANKIVHDLTKDNIVYFQDEQLSNWKKTKRNSKGRKCGFSYGKKIQHSCLGRIKQKLLMLERETYFQDACCISKFEATTKICFECDTKVVIGLNERTFICPNCGHTEDRDIHAAKNIKKIGTLKSAEWSERPSVEPITTVFPQLEELVLQALEI